ncbi:helix-turn-helix domain-containing protein [Amycolatopsis sp. cg9]|uniref:AraC family transcriptional regulator n=1 Tax=Amycolatopsis sp. cg9 TaxID=3238801 RepID=UPI0035255406
MYEEAAPPPRLAGVARCVWRSASAGPKRIVPDGCLDLVVGDGAVFIAGPDTAAWSSVTRPGAELHGLRFAPGRAAAVLGVAADELRDTRVPLGDLWGREGELLAERLLTGEMTPAEAVASRLPSAAAPDPAVAELVTRLEAGAARVAEAVTPPSTRAPVKDPAEPATISERRLRRRFVQAVGYGPATYLRVSRFQRAIALAPGAPNLAALAVAAGYSDQAHLSRDCRALTGLTPRAYFRPASTVDTTARDRLHSA